jgi:hypothetical protein
LCQFSAGERARRERANRTLQDRLVKNLHLKNISDIESANRYIEEFTEKYNSKFGEIPTFPQDVHRKNIPEEEKLDFILCERENRSLSKNLELNFRKSIFQIQLAKGKIGYSLRKQTVQVCSLPDGQIKLWYKNRFLNYKVFEPNKKTVVIVTSKEISTVMDKIFSGTKHKLDKSEENYACKQGMAKIIMARRLERLSRSKFTSRTKD